LRGDSRTALSWVTEGKFTSRHAISAAILLKAIITRFEFSFAPSLEFISSDENRVCDARSRGSDPSELENYLPLAQSEARFTHSGRCLFGAPAPATMALIALADPIPFRDRNVIVHENLLLLHLERVETALTAWVAAVQSLG
jgi:hypothetical protein